MAELKGLIRLRRFALDNLRKEMAILNTRVGSLERQIRQIDRSLISEKKIAETIPDGAQRYGVYAEGMKIRKSGLNDVLKELEEKRLKLQDKVTEAFMDLKAVEITQDQRDEAARAKAKIAEIHQLDEIGSQRHRRKQVEEAKE